jgi:peptidoglycan/xylan/chitin deacetylase (PgdA/CDA1 family)
MTINFLVQKEYFSRRLDYVVRSIAGRLGYPYKIITESKSIKKQDLTIAYLPEKRLDKIPQYVSVNVFNSEQLTSLEEAERSVNLFERSGQSIPIVGNRLIPGELKGWKRGKNEILYKKLKSDSWLLPIDIFLNVFFHFSRYEEKWRHFTEETATDHSSSILSRYHDLNVPVVDVLIAYLDDIIRDRIKQDKKVALRVLPWPGGEDLGIAFTHDVDITRGFNLKTRVVKTGEGYLHRLLGKSQTLDEAKSEIKEKDEQSWNFPELIDHYSIRKWKATFFFIAKIMEGRHLRYNVFSKKFKNLFKNLKENGHEIALHPSKYSFDRPRYYREEKQKLESATGMDINGMRQHYLRAKFPRLWIFAERASLDYDSSLGYNFQAGFRAGTSHPFKTYDVFDDKPLSLTEFSLHLFEYNLPDSGEDIEKSKSVISELVREVSKYQGLLVSLLHPSNFVHEPYRQLWTYLEEILSKRNLYVATFSEHLMWLRGRERIGIDMLYNRKKIPQIDISLPGGLHSFSFELIGDIKPDSDKKYTLDSIKKGCYCISTKRSKVTLILKKSNQA